MSADRYELMEPIGSGGMATVWRAYDRRLNRFVALKRPHVDAAGRIDRARFAREARAAAAIVHPNVVALHDAGVDEQGPYLVMEMVDGPTLAAGAGEVAAAELGAEIASALDAIHRAGITHGDVKPANILLAPGGAKLSDFGIARGPDDTVTYAPGMMSGTPAYAAPETLATGERSPAADVYSLASVLHEVVTGARWNAALGSSPAAAPAPWAALLAPALSPEPHRRPTAASFSQALRDLAENGPAATPTTFAPVGGADGRAGWLGFPVGRVQMAGIAIVVLVAAAALAVAIDTTRDDDDGDGDLAASVPVTPAADDTTTTSTSTTTTSTTTTTTTTTSTTTTTTTTTTLPVRTAAIVAGDVIATVVAIDDLSEGDADDIVERVSDVIRAFTDDPDDDRAIERALERAASIAAEKLDDDDISADSRAGVQTLLVELAEQTGGPPSVVVDEFDRVADDDDDDD